MITVRIPDDDAFRQCTGSLRSKLSDALSLLREGGRNRRNRRNRRKRREEEEYIAMYVMYVVWVQESATQCQHHLLIRGVFESKLQRTKKEKKKYRNQFFESILAYYYFTLR